MQTLVSICLLLAAFPLVAQEKGIFERALNRLQSLRGSGQNCIFCISAHNPEEKSDQEKCLDELCPIEFVSDEEYTQSARESAKSDPEYKAMRRLILEVIEKQVKDKREADVRLLKALRDNIEITDGRALTMGKLSRFPGKVSASLELDGHKINFDQSRNQLIAEGMNPDDTYMVLKYYQEYLDMNADPELVFTDYEDLKAGLDEAAFKARMRKGVEEIVRANEILSTSSGLPMDLLYSKKKKEEILKLIERGEVSEHRFDDMKQELLSARIRDKLYRDPKRFEVTDFKSFRLAELAPKGLEERLKMQIRVADRILAKDYSQSDDPYRVEMENTFRKCNYALEEGYAMSPTKAQLDSFKLAEKNYRKEFAANLKNALSTKSAKEIGDASSKWDIKYPPLRPQFMATYAERLKSEMEDEDVSLHIDNIKADAQQLALVEYMMSDEMKDDGAYFEDLKDVCTSEVPQARGDFAMFLRNRINVSARTVVRPEFTKKILFHEYAHLTSHHIDKGKGVSSETKKWYADVRDCLDQQRGSKKFFTEEDFVESLGAQIGPDAANFICMGKSTLSKDESFTLNDASYDKLHSGPLYNLLLSHIARGKPLPESCRRGLVAKGEKDLPENCFAKVKSPASKR